MKNVKILYLDCSSGISGDMFTGAMLGLGVDPQKLKTALMSLGLDDFDIEIGKTQKCGIAATKFNVIIKPHDDEHSHSHRNLGDIEKIIDGSTLSDNVKALSKKIFGVVARAEGAVHGLPVDEVHFHEVGAADSIADIVAAAFCLEEIGAEKIVCSPLCEGSGQVVCEHGVFPVPAPATAEILRAAAVPYKTTDEKGEMVTPTGAAIAAAICTGFGSMPEMTVERIGCGAGTKDFTRPNILRAFLGRGIIEESDESTDTVEVLETCIDDTTGEALGSCLDELLKEGIRDAYFTPVFMKKGRPAYMLTVLCDKEVSRRAAEMIFARTGSIGLRIHTSSRIVMQREIKNVATCYGDIPVKFSYYGSVTKYKAEAEAVEKAAKTYHVLPSDIYKAVSDAEECNFK